MTGAPPTDNESLAAAVEALCEPIAQELHLEVLDVAVGADGKKGGLVRVTVERLDASGPGTGVTVDELAESSREIDSALEREEIVPFDYRLEVTSPGVERELRRDRDFERHRGDQVRAVLGAPASNGQNVVEGKLIGHDDETLTVRSGEEDVVIQRESIRRIRTVFDFKKGKKKGRKKKKRR